MKPEQIFPTILIVLQWCAAVPYIIKHNYWVAAYWLFAGMLNVTVTFGR